MGSFDVSTMIDRPVDEVFEVVSHIENNSKWSSLVLEAKQTTGDAKGYFKVAEPVVLRVGKRQLQSDLDTLKEMMEAGLL